MMRLAILVMLGLICLVATAQEPEQVVNATIDALVAQDKSLLVEGYALHMEGEQIESRTPGRSQAYERISAAGPGYRYSAGNHRRIQETAPHITGINQMQFHTDKWTETAKFDGHPRLVRRLGQAQGSLIYQPSSIRDGSAESQEARLQPPLQRLLTGLIWTSPMRMDASMDLKKFYRESLTLDAAQYDAGNVVAIFVDESQTHSMTFGWQVGYMPTEINITHTINAGFVLDVELEIQWQKLDKYWLPTQIKHTTQGVNQHSADDVALAWKVGNAAPKLTRDQDDYRATIMGAFGKPYSRIVDGKVIPRPYQKGPKSLFPLELEELPYEPTAGEPIADAATARSAIEFARQAERKLLERVAVLVESECYKDTMQFQPAFTNRWAEQRIYSQRGDQFKFGAYNQITGPKKDKHLWEELLQAGNEIKYRSDVDVFPPRNVSQAKPYTGKPDGYSLDRFLQLRRRVTPFYPLGGCFGGQSVFNVNWDVTRGAIRGKLIAVRRLADGSIRSYWHYTDPDRKPPMDLRGVMVHDPDAGFLPTQVTWHGSFPSRLQTEWSLHGDIYVPKSTRLIKPVGHGSDMGEMHQINIYRWLIGPDSSDDLFDSSVVDLRAPVMDFFSRPFTRTTADSNLRAQAAYQMPPELAKLSDPPNLAPKSFDPFGN
jgi:hypothetical protein